MIEIQLFLIITEAMYKTIDDEIQPCLIMIGAKYKTINDEI